MVKKSKIDSFLERKISNRISYTIIAVFALMFITVGVFALTPGTAPNPGHLISQLAPPSPCTANQFLQFDGTNWVCATPSTGTPSQWVTQGNDIYFGSKVGIGTSTISNVLSVSGVTTTTPDIGQCTYSGVASCSSYSSSSSCNAVSGCSWSSQTTYYDCSAYNGNQQGCQSQSGCSWGESPDIVGGFECSGTYPSTISSCVGNPTPPNCAAQTGSTTCNAVSGCSWQTTIPSTSTTVSANFGGNVGIGTATPTHPLVVVGTGLPGGKGLLLSPNDVAIWGQATNGGSHRLLFLGNNNDTYINAPPNQRIQFRIGDVGKADLDRNGVLSVAKNFKVNTYSVPFIVPGSISGASSCSTLCTNQNAACLGSVFTNGDMGTCTPQEPSVISSIYCLCYRD